MTNTTKVIITAIFIVLLVPYIFVEGNTILFGGEFMNEYRQTDMIDEISYFKVFYVTKNVAKVYYVDRNHSMGNFVWFKKKNSKWEIIKWDTVWSEQGSASGMTFPYYR